MRALYAAVVLLAIGTTAAGQNLLQNPGFEDGTMNGWTILQNGGTGFAVVPEGNLTPYSVRTSSDWNVKAQEIDLHAAGYGPAQLAGAPEIRVSEWVVGYSAVNDRYYLKVELRNSNHTVLASWNLGSRQSPYIVNGTWQEIAHTFTRYPAGVQYIYFESGGRDASSTPGNYGSMMDNALVSIAANPVQQQPPSPFSRIGPGDGALVSPNMVTFSWDPSNDPNGSNVSYELSFQVDGIEYTYPVTGTEFSISLRSLPIPYTWHSLTWQVSASSDGDTVPATNGSGAFTLLKPIRYGDASMNGAVSALDATEVLRGTTGKAVLSDSAATAADVTGNGKVTSFDAAYILGHVVGTVSNFPADPYSAAAKPARASAQAAWGEVTAVADGFRVPLSVWSVEGAVTALTVEVPAGNAKLLGLESSLPGGWQTDYATVDGSTRIVAAGVTPINPGEVLALTFDGADGIAGIVRFNENNPIELGTALSQTAPHRYALWPNAPNPFNPTTVIGFTMPEAGRVTIGVWDVTGRRVRTLIADRFAAGYHEVVWNGTDDAGRAVASGVYLYRMSAPGFTATRRATLIR